MVKTSLGEGACLEDSDFIVALIGSGPPLLFLTIMVLSSPQRSIHVPRISRRKIFGFSAPNKGVIVFALPGELGLIELVGDFKIHFHDG